MWETGVECPLSPRSPHRLLVPRHSPFRRLARGLRRSLGTPHVSRGRGQGPCAHVRVPRARSLRRVPCWRAELSFAGCHYGLGSGLTPGGFCLARCVRPLCGQRKPALWHALCFWGTCLGAGGLLWGKVRSGSPGQGSWTAVLLLLGTFRVEMGVCVWWELGPGEASVVSLFWKMRRVEGTRGAVGCRVTPSTFSKREQVMSGTRQEGSSRHSTPHTVLSLIPPSPDMWCPEGHG